ncbi:MAG: hypothetical protein GY873_10595 [Bosea sp.]|uniref:hypothetical protein n=1 Tax=Bosea sp. (in: a-proteobacteria) TaxID=1871050 RepID=UPI0023A4B48A|nr:hypothetical protein [Bosea sp. (in: a-proteobacteria)]MCP4734629.1 hypothetical protein [Bosea sp. (in: a-proteobacteria)]
MAAHALASLQESEFLEGLRVRYEQQGFTFQTHPGSSELPTFFGSYRPDAIAQKPGLNIAIEVKNQNSAAAQDSLQRIRRVFDGHPDWRFDVVFMGASQAPRIAIRPASPAMLRTRIDDVHKMTSQGQNRAAFVMAWSLLEAALHSKAPETANKPLTPGTVLQTLAMNGYIEPQLEQRVRSLIDLRNRIVHGDVDVEPALADVQLVLSAISETLEANAA